MSSITALAVAAPIVHFDVNPAPQLESNSISVNNVVGGTAILIFLAVMITAGLSAAGMLKFNRAVSAHSDAPHTAH